MAVSKKNRRRITVDGRGYLWWLDLERTSHPADPHLVVIREDGEPRVYHRLIKPDGLDDWIRRNDPEFPEALKHTVGSAVARPRPMFPAAVTPGFVREKILEAEAQPRPQIVTAPPRQRKKRQQKRRGRHT